MTIEGNGTELDLDAILAARWADPQVLPAAEFARDEAFWRARRAQDEEFVAVRAKARASAVNQRFAGAVIPLAEQPRRSRVVTASQQALAEGEGEDPRRTGPAA